MKHKGCEGKAWTVACAKRVGAGILNAIERLQVKAPAEGERFQ